MVVTGKAGGDTLKKRFIVCMFCFGKSNTRLRGCVFTFVVVHVLRTWQPRNLSAGMAGNWNYDLNPKQLPTAAVFYPGIHSSSVILVRVTADPESIPGTLSARSERTDPPQDTQIHTLIWFTTFQHDFWFWGEWSQRTRKKQTQTRETPGLVLTTYEALAEQNITASSAVLS